MGRRVLRAGFVLASVIATLWLPTSASAQTCTVSDNGQYGCDVSVATLATYKGWAHVSLNQYCGGMVPSDTLLAQLAAPRPAWRWTGSAWQRASFAPGTQVYVWPYAVGWSWVWTQRTGWLAIQDSQLIINPTQGCPFDAPGHAA